MYLRRLAEVRIDLQRLSGASRDRQDVPASMTTFADFLATDVDGFHGRKEEEGLFPVLVRHVGLDGGPVEVMLEEHELLRQHQKTIAGGIPRLETDPGSLDALSAVSVATGSIDRLLTLHIDKEDEVLFPMARATLTPAEMSEVAQVCQEIEDRFGDRVRASRRSPRDGF